MSNQDETIYVFNHSVIINNMNISLFNHTLFELSVYGLSAVFSSIAVIITTILIILHIKWFSVINAQKPIIRILIMVPLYALISFVSILFYEYSIYFDIIRDCYEAFVLYQFFALLVHYFTLEAQSYIKEHKVEFVDDNGEHIIDVIEENVKEEIKRRKDDKNNNKTKKKDVDDTEIAISSDDELEKLEDGIVNNKNMEERGEGGKKDDIEYRYKRLEVLPTDEEFTVGGLLKDICMFKSCPFPFCCIMMEPGVTLYIRIKRCIWQYVLLKPILSIIAIILQATGYYHNGTFDIKYGFLWITMIMNISICIALYALVIFYSLIYKVIKKYQPFAKLLSIKMILFFIFWQSVIISLLYYFNLVPIFYMKWTQEQTASIINNFIICIEMVILSFIHIFTFSYEEYKQKKINDIVSQKEEYQMEELSTQTQTQTPTNTTTIFNENPKRKLGKKDRKATKKNNNRSSNSSNGVKIKSIKKASSLTDVIKDAKNTFLGRDDRININTTPSQHNPFTNTTTTTTTTTSNTTNKVKDD